MDRQAPLRISSPYPIRKFLSLFLSVSGVSSRTLATQQETLRDRSGLLRGVGEGDERMGGQELKDERWKSGPAPYLSSA